MGNWNNDSLRVELLWRSGEVGVTDFQAGGSELVVYKNMKALPKWIQERLAVLTVMGESNRVEGVGEKVSEFVFWINEK